MRGEIPGIVKASCSQVEQLGPMNMTDPIADMLTRIRNAQMTEKATLRCRRLK
jgi:hypothetical protein